MKHISFFLQVQKNPLPILVFYLWGLGGLTNQDLIKCLSFSFFFSTALTHIESTLSSLQRQLWHTQWQLSLLCKGNFLFSAKATPFESTLSTRIILSLLYPQGLYFWFCPHNNIANTQLCSLLVGHWDRMEPTKLLFIINNAIYVHK